MGRHTSVSGNTLKRTTGLIKIKYMYMVMDFKADLKEKQTSEYQRRIEERLSSLMWELRELDLAWEAWFDNDNNVPDVSHAQIIPYIERRIASLKIPQPLELRRRGYLWAHSENE